MRRLAKRVGVLEKEAMAFERVGFRLAATVLGLHALEAQQRLRLDLAKSRIEEVVADFKKSLEEQKEKAKWIFFVRVFTNLLPVLGPAVVDIFEALDLADLPGSVGAAIDEVAENADSEVTVVEGVDDCGILGVRGFRPPSKYKTARGCIPPLADIVEADKWVSAALGLLSRLKSTEKDKARLEEVLDATRKA